MKRVFLIGWVVDRIDISDWNNNKECMMESEELKEDKYVVNVDILV